MSVQLPIQFQEQNNILHVLLELLTKEQLIQSNKYNKIIKLQNDESNMSDWDYYKKEMNKFYKEHANILKLKDLIKCIKDVVSKKNNRFWLIDSIKSVREFLNYYQNGGKIPCYCPDNLIEITAFIKYNYQQVQYVKQLLLNREIELCQLLAI
jgi:hypothetical protein